jgi:hypothetical protein
MHRLLVLKPFSGNQDKFQVVADSSNPNVSKDNPISIKEAGGSEWAGYPDDLPEYSSISVFPLPCKLKVSEVGFWHVKKTGKSVDYDFVANELAELKTIVDGELHIEYEGRSYRAGVGESIIFWMDPNDKEGGKIRPYMIKFKGDTECTIVYAEYFIS